MNSLPFWCGKKPLNRLVSLNYQTASSAIGAYTYHYDALNRLHSIVDTGS